MFSYNKIRLYREFGVVKCPYNFMVFVAIFILHVHNVYNKIVITKTWLSFVRNIFASRPICIASIYINTKHLQLSRIIYKYYAIGTYVLSLPLTYIITKVSTTHIIINRTYFYPILQFHALFQHNIIGAIGYRAFIIINIMNNNDSSQIFDNRSYVMCL